jgi:hypothetical protein
MDKLQGDEAAIKETAAAILRSGIMKAAPDTLKNQILKKKLKELRSDHFEVIYQSDHEFKKPNEPIDSVVVLSRIRKSSVLMWGGEDIIYDFSKSDRVFPDTFEEDGYQFRKAGDRIYYRRYYFRAT